jgi:3-oxoacyl-[acyl-carrier protein] reductase
MSEPTGLAGCSAIVTGASMGLGAGITRELIRQGARVLVCSRSEENLRALVETVDSDIATGVSAEPGPVSISRPITLAADVTDPETAPRLAAAARDAFGGLDILVCNAGGPPPGDFAEIDDGHWEDAFRLILLSPVRLIRACLPMLRASRGGRIAVISSISSIRPVQRLALSNTLRPALAGLARHLAVEFAPDDILVNAIAPGFFDTERSREVLAAIAEQAGREPEEVRAELVRRVPIARQGDPRELGRLVSFLVSEKNSYITGQTIIIDGGLLTT